MIRDVQIAGGKIDVRRLRDAGRHRRTPRSASLQLHRPRQPRTVRAIRTCSPARGQLAILEPQPEVRYAFTGGPGYMFPRPDGILLGGTFEVDEWDATPSPATIARILARHKRSSTPSAAPLEVLPGASDIRGEMNYQASIPQAAGSCPSAQGQADAQGDRRRAERAYRRPGRRQDARSRSRCATAGGASSSSPELRDEVTPKNILMIGPTGCGKTEISRRLAKLADAPFVKVEATKFTEVGYVGRDVEQIARDLVEEAVRLERERRRAKVRAAAEEAAMDKLLDALTGKGSSEATRAELPPALRRRQPRPGRGRDRRRRGGRNAVRDPRHGRAGVRPEVDHGQGDGRQAPRKRRKLKVPDAFARLTEEEADKRLDPDDINRVALADAEANGIVFLDEIDKIAVSDVRGGSISREGVQRDLLPLIEGTTVATKYGPLKTDHILFIAIGRLPHRQAGRPAARASGPAADPGRAEGADAGGFRPHPVRHAGEPDRAISGAARHRGRDDRLRRGRHRRRSRASPPR